MFKSSPKDKCELYKKTCIMESSTWREGKIVKSSSYYGRDEMRCLKIKRMKENWEASIHVQNL